MRFQLFAAAILLAAASLPVAAYSDPAQSGDPAQTTMTNPDEVVCKTSPAPTGSRLGGGRECHTQREWSDREKEAQKQLQDRQMHGLQSCIGSCNGG